MNTRRGIARPLVGVAAFALLSTCATVAPAAPAATSSRALEIAGHGGTETNLVVNRAVTITSAQWTNRAPSSPDAGFAISATSLKTPIAQYWLPTLRHGSEAVSTVIYPVKLAAGRYKVTLLGAGQLEMRLLWSGPRVSLFPRGKATLRATAKTDYATTPFDHRWLANVPDRATVMAGYIVYGVANAAEVHYCFLAGQDSCLAPLGGYTGVERSGDTMYYLTYPPGQLSPGQYEFGELAVSDSAAMQAGGYVVTLAP